MRFLRRNLISTYAVYAASVLSGLVVTPVIVHALGTEQYGLLAFVAAATLFLTLLDLGVAPSIIRFGAEQRGRQSPEETSALASVGLVVYAAIGSLTVAAGLVLAWFVPLIVATPDDLVWPVRLATLLLALGMAARFPLGLFSNLLAAQQRYDVLNLAGMISLVVYAALVVAVVPHWGGIAFVAAATLVTTVLRLALPLGWLKRELPFLRMRRSLVTREQLRRLLSFSWHNFLIHIAGKAVLTADVVIVGVVLGAEAAAFYAIPAKFFALGFGLGTAGINLLAPAFAELEGAEQIGRQRQYLLAGLRSGMAFMLLLALPLVLIPDQLVRGWIGEGFEESTWVGVLLGLTLLVHQPLHVFSQYLIARAQQRPLAMLLGATSVVNIVLSVALASTVGLWGVALSTLVTDLVAAAVVPRFVARASGLSYWTLARAWLRPLPPALVVAVIVLVLGARAYDASDLPSVVLLGIVWVALTVPVIWRFGFEPPERRTIARRLWSAHRAPVLASPEQPT